MTFDEVVSRAIRIEKRLSIFYFVDQLKVYFVEVSIATIFNLNAKHTL